MTQRALFLVLALTTAGCAAGGQDPQSTGYVLLDGQARSAGRLSQGEWDDAPVLPVALEVTGPVAFSSPAGRSVFDLQPGMLAYVHGAAGSIEWLRLGAEVSDERLIVYGDHAAAADLAQRVAGKLEGGQHGVYTVSAPEIYDRGSFLAPPDGVQEVAPDLVVPEKGLSKAAVLGPAPIMPGPSIEDGDDAPQGATLVGIYTSGGNALILDAAGGFEIDDACSGDLIGRGRYRAEGARVVLDGEATPMVLSLEEGALLDPSGGRFVPLIPPADDTPRPKADMDDEGGDR